MSEYQTVNELISERNDLKEALKQVVRYFDAKFDAHEINHLPACYERAQEAIARWAK